MAWDEPDAKNGEITGYTITYTGTNKEESDVHQLREPIALAGQRQWTFSDLIAGYTYTFKVLYLLPLRNKHDEIKKNYCHCVVLRFPNWPQSILLCVVAGSRENYCWTWRLGGPGSCHANSRLI